MFFTQPAQPAQPLMSNFQLILITAVGPRAALKFNFAIRILELNLKSISGFALETSVGGGNA